MDWLASTLAPKSASSTSAAQRDGVSDDDDYAPAAEPAIAPIITLPTMGQLNDIMNKYTSTFELKSVRPNELDTEQPDSIPVDARPDRSVPIPSVDPNAELQTVAVEKERDRALESLIQTLFGPVNTPAVSVTLRAIVRQQASAKAVQRQQRSSAQDITAVNLFYRFLVEVIKVLSIACADEAQGAPVYTESRRRPILHLWKGVLADFSALQSIFKYAYQHDSPLTGRMPPDIIEPRDALQIYNRKLARMKNSLAVSEQRLGAFDQTRRECERKVEEVRRPYESSYTAIQLEEAKIDSTKSSIDAFTDIRVMAASAVAAMKGAVGPDEGT